MLETYYHSYCSVRHSTFLGKVRSHSCNSFCEIPYLRSFCEYWEKWSFSVYIEIKILVIHNKNSFASPLNNDEWITFHDCREIFYILSWRDSFSALQQCCNLLKMHSLLCDSGTYHQCKKLHRSLLRLFFLWETIYILKAWVVPNNLKLREVTWLNRVDLSGREQGIPAVSSSSLFLVHSCVTSVVSGSSDTPQTLSAATFGSLMWQRERGRAPQSDEHHWVSARNQEVAGKQGWGSCWSGKKVTEVPPVLAATTW